MTQASVIVNTYNRAIYLERCLESLSIQTLQKDDFEIVLVDDGSSDSTPEIAKQYSDRLNVVYIRQENSGIARARNVGILAAKSNIIIFFDDDDVATSDYIFRHIELHREHDEIEFVVLSKTLIKEDVSTDLIMHYVTEVGGELFSYNGLETGGYYDFRNFWGGRISCKRSLMMDYGFFDENFRFGYEDIDLAYRLSRVIKLKIYYDENILQIMQRRITFEEFEGRCVKQGRSLVRLAAKHKSIEIQNYARTDWLLEIHQKEFHKLSRMREIILDIIKRGWCVGKQSHSEERLVYQLLQSIFLLRRSEGVSDGTAEFSKIDC